MWLAVGGLIAVIAFAIIGGIIMAREGAKNADRKPLQNGSEKSLVSPDQSSQLKAAEKDLRAARNNAYQVANLDLRATALETLDKAEKVVKEMKEQPQEIRRANQFFSYYLPTLQVVLEKYLALEKNGQLKDDTAEKTSSYFVKMGDAFDKQYTAMFKDEQLDLTVEIEAMELALKREGLS